MKEYSVFDEIVFSIRSSFHIMWQVRSGLRPGSLDDEFLSRRKAGAKRIDRCLSRRAGPWTEVVAVSYTRLIHQFQSV